MSEYVFYKLFQRAVFKMDVPVKDLKDMSRQEIEETYKAFQFEKRSTERLRASLALHLIKLYTKYLSSDELQTVQVTKRKAKAKTGKDKSFLL